MPDRDPASATDTQPGVDARHQAEGGVAPGGGGDERPASPAVEAAPGASPILPDGDAAARADRGTPANASAAQDTRNATDDDAERPETTEPG